MACWTHRWFEAHQEAPRFCFGHGLSFTSYTYSDLKINRAPDQAVRNATKVEVSFQLQNSGKVAGKEIPQLYLSFPTVAGEPLRQLKGLRSAQLVAGAKTIVTFSLTSRDISIWDAVEHGWKEISGTFGVAVGASSCDLRLNGTFAI